LTQGAARGSEVEDFLGVYKLLQTPVRPLAGGSGVDDDPAGNILGSIAHG